MWLQWRAYTLNIRIVAGSTGQKMVLQNSGRYKVGRGRDGGGDQENV